MNDVLKRQIDDAAAVLGACTQLLPMLESAVVAVVKALQTGGMVAFCGNGGSASQAQHFAAELVARFRRERRAFRAVALTTDTSILTAVGNDYCFDKVFSRQVEALLRPGDVLIALSTSGQAAN
ncbi:MAG: SIS domain-containing protein, partial [Armatimonadetes bacterium]|nr:SIS domain-containing protein [Armatimonadota bacterium]